MMSKYVRVAKSVYDKGTLLPVESYMDTVDYDKEYYVSTYLYNQNHYEQFKKSGSIKGISDVTSNMLWFDFDDETNPDASKKDAVEVIERLKAYGISEKNIEAYFSGRKGFHVVVNFNRQLTPSHIKAIVVNKFGKNLKTLDMSLYDTSQLLRIPGTKNPRSGLYKIPLTPKELASLTIDEIKKMATSLDNITNEFNWDEETLPEEFLKLENEVQKKEVLTKPTVPLEKPRHWKDYKWSLLQGNFEVGERHSAMMVIAATCRGLGYDSDTATAMCLAADAKHCELKKDSPIEDLESNIIPSIYSESWKGGQYSPHSDPWLAKYCEKNGFEVDSKSDDATIAIEDAFTLFKDYAMNIDELTVKTGIPAIDKKLRMTIGMVVGIVAAPGVGKTSLALQMLNSMSKRGEQAIFFSYDMYHALVIQKLVQHHLKVDGEEVFERIKNRDTEFEAQILKMLKEEYANVEFCFKQGQTPKDIEETIKQVEDRTGKKVRLAVIDYGELVMSDFSDATAASAQVQHKLREIANTYNLCVLSLLQPNKMSGSPADSIKSYRAAKGSSAIEQTVSVMLGMSRPGYDPDHPEDDKFITINALKVRMGSLFSTDLHWEGFTGTVREMTVEEKDHLHQVRERIKAEEESSKDSSWS